MAVIISSISDLIDLSNGVYGYGTSSTDRLEVSLTADLDFATDDDGAYAYSNWGGCSSGTWYINFDGHGHSIKNLTYQGSANWALFRTVGAGTIKDLKLKDINVSGGSYVAGIVNYMASGVIQDCHVSGRLLGQLGSSSNTYCTAGIMACSRTENGTINVTFRRCTFAGYINGTHTAGIMATYGYNVTTGYAIWMYNCEVNADIEGSVSATGLLNYGWQITIENCSFIGSLVTGSSVAYALVANTSSGQYKNVSFCYFVVKHCDKTTLNAVYQSNIRKILYDSDVASAAGYTVSGAEGATTAELQSQAYMREQGYAV